MYGMNSRSGYPLNFGNRPEYLSDRNQRPMGIEEQQMHHPQQRRFPDMDYGMQNQQYASNYQNQFPNQNNQSNLGSKIRSQMNNFGFSQHENQNNNQFQTNPYQRYQMQGQNNQQRLPSQQFNSFHQTNGQLNYSQPMQKKRIFNHEFEPNQNFDGQDSSRNRIPTGFMANNYLQSQQQERFQDSRMQKIKQEGVYGLKPYGSDNQGVNQWDAFNRMNRRDDPSTFSNFNQMEPMLYRPGYQPSNRNRHIEPQNILNPQMNGNKQNDFPVQYGNTNNPYANYNRQQNTFQPQNFRQHQSMNAFEQRGHSPYNYGRNFNNGNGRPYAIATRFGMNKTRQQY